ncbi:hypothetical protein [Bacteroides caecigallinarum]|uniref:hypothetical protein n=1 Tax=Bacteroides caecigallinarum TaxID=1411144 RepID=UPI001F33A5F6|nr:hypothetical protein [Bacteroides caecigallinarum]MCF2738232.1 hypothetical protein [Bacteroides caecigallinarum]
MITLILISLLTIATYTAIVTIKSEIPYSISETYYRLNNKKWFTFVMLFTAITLLPAALDNSSENSQFLIFLSIAGMGVVGLSPNFIHGEKSEQIAHYIGSGMLLIFSQCWVGCNLPWALTCWIVYIMWIIFNYNKSDPEQSFYNRLVSTKPVFYAELIVMITVYATVLRNYLFY